MSDTVKILVVDDSVVYRQILLAVIARIPDAECVGTAASGPIALAKLPILKPDLLLLDVVMPDMDGIEILQRARQIAPDIEAIMVSAFDMHHARNTLKSLQIGALDFVPKPKGNHQEDNIVELARYLRPLVQLAQTRKYADLSRKHQHGSLPPPLHTTKPITLNNPIIKTRTDLILIGISTGGPKALGYVLPQLPAKLPCPVLVVQHLPPMFTESLAMKLDMESPLHVAEAKGGEALNPGFIYIAPGGKHLVVKRLPGSGYGLAVNEDPPVNNCRPAVDVLFASVAEIFRGNILAVVMTGMGRDGTEGVRLLKHGVGRCRCLIQDENSSVVWGMPGSVFEAGLADEVIPLEQLGARIIQLAL